MLLLLELRGSPFQKTRIGSIDEIARYLRTFAVDPQTLGMQDDTYTPQRQLKPRPYRSEAEAGTSVLKR